MPDAARPRMLIVDDEPALLDWLERVFRDEYDLTRATSTEEAAACLDRAPFDVLLTDDRMPGEGGLALCARYGARAGLARILLTGNSERAEIHSALARGELHAHLPKPVDSGTLREAVARARELASATPPV